MAWILLGAWHVWSLGPGEIGQEALAVDSGGKVHLVYKSGDNRLVHAWFTGNTWESETLGNCTLVPILRVGTVDKGLHILAGQSLTYYYSSGSGWTSKALGYSTSDYDLLVQGTPTVLFSSGGTIYKGTGDTLGNFNIDVEADSWSKIDTIYYPYECNYSGKRVRGPVAFYEPNSSDIMFFGCEYEYEWPCPPCLPEGEGPNAPVPTCNWHYSGITGGACGDCRDQCCGYYPVYEITTEYTFGIYNSWGMDTIRTFPTVSVRGGFRGPDICRSGSDCAISAISRTDSSLWFFQALADTIGEPVDTFRAKGLTSIASPDTSQVFIAFTGKDGDLRVALKTSRLVFLTGSVVLRGPSQSGGYIRFTTTVKGFMDCRLYRVDGRRAYSTAREVREWEEVLIPVSGLGSGVYYLWVEIASYTGLFRVILI
jgi:hypothetical protein